MNKKVILVVIIVTLLSFIPLFISNVDSKAPKLPYPKNLQKDQPKSEFETYYLVPVTKFTSLLNDYDLENSNDYEIKTTTSNLIILPENITIEGSTDIMPEEIDENEIFLLRPDQISPQYKTLSVNGIYFWDKNIDLSNYPLQKNVDKAFVKFPNEAYSTQNLTTFFAGGEIIPARAVDRLGLNKFDNHTYVYDFFKDDIESADLAMALLENSLLGNPSPCTGCMSFVGDDKNANALKEVGFDLISTAGNHAGDAGQDAYKNTLKLLDTNDILHSGTTNSINDLLIPAVREVNSKKIGFIGADDIAYYYWKQSDTTNYGTNYFSTRNESGQLIPYNDAIDKLPTIKAEYNIDYLIIFMSWGIEYTNYATTHQTELAHLLIDNGADLIVSSHPHWVQNIEFYKDTPIIYSLGNFVFDQTHTTPTRQGAVINLHYYKNELKNIEIMPHQTCGYHQTQNNLIESYLNNELSLEEVYDYDESKGCVYWQPKKLDSSHTSYNQILERIYEYTEI